MQTGRYAMNTNRINANKMKKLFCAAAIAVAGILWTIPASAGTGVDLGYLNSSYRSKMDGAGSVKSEPMNGFFVGVNDDVRLFAGLSVQPGLYYSYLNSTGREELTGLNLSNSYTEHLLNIPIHLKYTFDIVPMFGIYIFAGPTLSVGLAATDKMTVTGDIAGAQINGSLSYNAYSGKFKSDNLSEFSDRVTGIVDPYLHSRMNRFDVLMGGGLGLDLLKFVTVKAGFDYGLMNRFKGDMAEAGTLNRMQFYVAVGIQF